MALVDGRGARGALIAGRTCAASGWLLWVLMQALADDPFPPEISISQYGLGEFGWVFTVWALTLAAAPLLLLSSLPSERSPAPRPSAERCRCVDDSLAGARPVRAAPVPGPAAAMLWVGFAGAAVMAFVRTDEGGGAMSWHAQVHMVGAIVALVFLPLGILAAGRAAGPWARRVAVVLVVAAAVVGALVVVSAAGVDTAGLGGTRSWALWQGTLVVIDMLLVSVYAAAVGQSRIRAADPGR
jgi:hypothetical protein